MNTGSLTTFADWYDTVGIDDPSVGLERSQWLTASYLLPRYDQRTSNSTNFLHLREDLELWEPLFSESSEFSVEFANPTLFERGAIRRLRFGSDTVVDFSLSGEHLLPGILPVIRGLASRALRREAQTEIPFHWTLNASTHLITTSEAVSDYLQQASTRLKQVERIGANDFARTANYMGSKRALGGFIVGAVADVLPSNGVVLDLMTGSGSAAAAFNTQWDTFASDAQSFSCLLAEIQGGGFSQEAASDVLEKITPMARRHAESLYALLKSSLTKEDAVLFSDANEETLLAFQQLMDGFPTYPTGGNHSVWNPAREVDLRQANNKLEPYCLFTAYFANTYFGIRQCVEIDSIRFAIDQLPTAQEQRWALGALIATLSAVGTTYAGHFAQPPVRAGVILNLAKLSKIQEQRSRSVLHEFSIRLLTLAKQSEESPRAIRTVAGPWQPALKRMRGDRLVHRSSMLVYLDAPYQREEYSRYYHVLETLVRYSYPTSSGVGRTPLKGDGPLHRFASEFFTHTQSRVTESLTEVVSTVLMNKWQCAWSYASNGIADIPTVIDAVTKRVPCKVHSVATPYVHNSQGRARSAKQVVEYLVFFSPK